MLLNITNKNVFQFIRLCYLKTQLLLIFLFLL